MFRASVLAAHHVENHIDPALVGGFEHDLHEIVLAIVDRPVGAEADARSALPIVPRRHEYTRAERLAERNGRGPNAAAATMNRAASRQTSARPAR